MITEVTEVDRMNPRFSMTLWCHPLSIPRNPTHQLNPFSSHLAPRHRCTVALTAARRAAAEVEDIGGLCGGLRRRKERVWGEPAVPGSARPVMFGLLDWPDSLVSRVRLTE